MFAFCLFVLKYQHVKALLNDRQVNYFYNSSLFKSNLVVSKKKANNQPDTPMRRNNE